MRGLLEVGDMRRVNVPLSALEENTDATCHLQVVKNDVKFVFGPQPVRSILQQRWNIHTLPASANQLAADP